MRHAELPGMKAGVVVVVFRVPYIRHFHTLIFYMRSIGRRGKVAFLQGSRAFFWSKMVRFRFSSLLKGARFEGFDAKSQIPSTCLNASNKVVGCVLEFIA